MSWSISGGGKKSFAAARIQEQSASLTYLTGPEKDLKDKAIAVVLETIEANPDDALLSITAYGSATKTDKGELQTVSITVRAQI